VPRALPPVAPDALTWRFTRAGGPGGQHVNTSSTRVELDCDVAACGFDPATTERIVSRLGPVVRIVVADTRSQTRNRAIAEERLALRLADAAAVPVQRRATRPRRSAVEARLADKRHRSSRTSERRRRHGSDD
jgi:ribosome-associated protein